MKLNKILALLFIQVLIFSSTIAQNLPTKKDVLNQMELTNTYFMNKWPDPGMAIVNDKTRPSNIWTRAVYYEGLMALYKINPDKAYYNYAVSRSDSHQWGLNGGIQTRNADNQCCGQIYIDFEESINYPE